MPDREKVISALECISNGAEQPCHDCEYSKREEWCIAECAKDALALLKAQEPVKPILARGWYWCGGIGCRNSLTSALENDIPARKPNYCERCGRKVKWE